MNKWKNKGKQTYSYSEKKLLDEIHKHSTKHSHLQSHNFMWHHHSSITGVGKYLAETISRKKTERKYYIIFCVHGGEHGNIITVMKNMFALKLKEIRIHHYWVFHMWLCFLVNKIYLPLCHTLLLRLRFQSYGTIHRQLFLHALIYTPNSIFSHCCTIRQKFRSSGRNHLLQQQHAKTQNCKTVTLFTCLY